MPFTRENRMSTLLIIAILITLAIGAFSIVSISNHSAGSPSTPIITSIIGFVGIAINQFLGMLKLEFNRKEARAESERLAQQAKEVKHTLEITQKKQERKLDRLLLGQGGPDETVKTKVEEHLADCQDENYVSPPGEEILPLTRKELTDLIRQIVHEVCSENRKHE